MAIALAIFGVAFAAFCVWLAVRIINRREKWTKWTAAVYIVLMVLVVYPLSFGPVVSLAHHDYLSDDLQRIAAAVYSPIVWAHENAATAVLHAYDAGNLAHELYNSNQAANNRDHFGTGNKYITPTVADGKVFVGTTSGVAVFGLLP